MNRFRATTAICTDFILDSDKAQAELHHRGWSIGHTAIDGVHQVSRYKQEARIIADAPTELQALLLTCSFEEKRLPGFGSRMCSTREYSESAMAEEVVIAT